MTAYCPTHHKCEPVTEVNESHRFPVKNGDVETGAFAREIRGRLECGRACHIVATEES